VCRVCAHHAHVQEKDLLRETALGYLTLGEGLVRKLGQPRLGSILGVHRVRDTRRTLPKGLELVAIGETLFGFSPRVIIVGILVQ
jgi:hypothetical protein